MCLHIKYHVSQRDRFRIQSKKIVLPRMSAARLNQHTNIHKKNCWERKRKRPAEMMCSDVCFFFSYFMSDNFFTEWNVAVRGFLNAFLCAFELASRCNNFTTQISAAVAVMLYVYACAGICDRRKISSTNTRI